MLPTLITSLPRPGARELAYRLFVVLVVSYGLLYFSYKFLVPTFGLSDSQYYYKVFVSPLDLHATMSPFVLRQVGGVLTYLAWRSHLFYPAEIAFASPDYDQHIFFAALLVNWLCLAVTAVIAGLIAEELLNERSSTLATFAALLCLLSFHTQSAVITSLEEGPAWLLMALGFLAYLRRSRVGVGVVLLLAVWQRELVLVALGCLAALDLLPRGRERRFALLTLGGALVGFAWYVALRRHYAGYDFQTQPTVLFLGLLRAGVDRQMIAQGLLTQNILVLALIGFFAAEVRPAAVNYWMPRLVVTFGALTLVGMAADVGNNVGRLAGILTPCFAAFAGVLLVGRGVGHDAAGAERDRFFVDTKRAGRRVLWILLAFVALLGLLEGTSRLSHHFRKPKHRHDEVAVPKQKPS